ncbi:MAG: glycosyl hydrolase [Chloroflexota bacterium]|nr:glycosyl hydrolase [Chloroflexota bacterium]
MTTTESQQAHAPSMPPELLGAVRWRCIGPPRGGRVVAVAGDPVNPMVFYFGACAGGVWKTTDGGTYWDNVSDGYFNTASVGAIAVAPSDPNVIYAGMGESCIRGDVTYGDGVYKSTDGGQTWTNMGLSDTRHISRVRVHPADPDVVYVAALGHAYGPNEERGVFRSTDRGKNWERVLFRSENAGAADLSLDPNNPRILYAAIWETRRTPWSLISGGEESGIFKSVDGGDTWTEITDNPGLPDGLKGRIGVAVSPAKSGRVWATIEAEDCGLYRTDDGGNTWELVSDNRDLQGRPWYYQHVFADPQDADTVWILNYQCWKSVDGGRNFNRVTTPHGDDHDLWFDPNNPLRMIEGNDGGACVSFNGGESWSTIYNQLTGQFYHLTTDNRFPHRVYGTQQDNTAISVPSRTHKGAIPWGDCYVVGNSESGHIALHPDDPDTVISGAIGSSAGGGGNMLHYDHATGQVRIITVWPELYSGWGAKDMKYRFQWTYPIMFSPHDNNTLYVAGNLVFRSTDLGSSWEAISPDLTRHDPSTLEPSGGPITKDTSGAEIYATIFAFVESPHQQGVFWTGSDDGLVHLSRNGGATWEAVTPPDLPEWSLICMIEVSPHDPATAYIAATRYKLDDTRPLLYRTTDYGQNWTLITNGLPEDDYTRVVREDPVRPGLLYCGTETGAYVSFDQGDSWQTLRANLPVVPVYDLQVKEDNLVAATHGRAFWILDDLTQLRQLDSSLSGSSCRLLQPRDTYRVRSPFRDRKPATGKSYRAGLGADVTYSESLGQHGEVVRKVWDAGENPPDGVIIHYYLKEASEEITITILDGDGGEIRSFSSNSPDAADENPEPRAPADGGMNRFVWNMRHPAATKVPEDKTTEDSLVGPLAPPGEYQVRVQVGDETQTQPFSILKDPRVSASQEDLDAQFRFLVEIRDKVSETHDGINQLRRVRQQVDQWVSRAQGHPSEETVADAAEAVKEKLKVIEDELIQSAYRGARDRLDMPTRLNRKLAELTAVVATADFAPPQQARQVFEYLSGEIDVQLTALQAVVDEDVAQFANLVRDLDIPVIAT